jgi:hypothetical protein
MTKDSAVTTAPSVLLKWEQVINDLGIGDSKGIEMESVDSSFVEVGVLNDSVKSVGILSKRCGCRQVPAIAD